jgi:tRNA(His) 5'-end guanylyltransferase
MLFVVSNYLTLLIANINLHNVNKFDIYVSLSSYMIDSILKEILGFIKWRDLYAICNNHYSSTYNTLLNKWL